MAFFFPPPSPPPHSQKIDCGGWWDTMKAVTYHLCNCFHVQTSAFSRRRQRSRPQNLHHGRLSLWIYGHLFLLSSSSHPTTADVNDGPAYWSSPVHGRTDRCVACSITTFADNALANQCKRNLFLVLTETEKNLSRKSLLYLLCILKCLRTFGKKEKDSRTVTTQAWPIIKLSLVSKCLFIFFSGWKFVSWSFDWVGRF